MISNNNNQRHTYRIGGVREARIIFVDERLHGRIQRAHRQCQLLFRFQQFVSRIRLNVLYAVLDRIELWRIQIVCCYSASSVTAAGCIATGTPAAAGTMLMRNGR